MFYDTAGVPMGADEFKEAYPERRHIMLWPLFGVVVGTDFVGINHAAGKGTPKIYETWVCVITRSGRVFVSSSWSGGLKRSVMLHGFTAVLVVFGGALWWRLRARRLIRAS
jgi:hypothetical protein